MHCILLLYNHLIEPTMSKRDSQTAELHEGAEVIEAKKLRTEAVLVKRNDIRLTLEKSAKLSKGKHAGKSYIMVAYCDPEYCNWVMDLKEGNLSACMSKFRKWLNTRCEQHAH